MKKRFRHRIFKIAGVLSIAVLSVIILVVVFNGEIPQRFYVHKTRGESSLSSSEEGKITINDEKRDFLLGYLDNFKTESADGVADETEVMRISRKNALIKEYKEYVDNLYNIEMTETVYKSHYENLMRLFKDLLLLEPEKSITEKTVNYIDRIIQNLDEYSALCKGENGEKLAKEIEFNEERADEALVALRTLKQRILDGVATKDEIKEEYSLCLEKFKAATPVNYALMLRNELIIESLPD